MWFEIFLQPNFFSKTCLNNPDILSCYNATAENYNFDKVKKSFKDSIDVDLLDPFAGVIGEDLDIINNNLTVDKNKALEELDYSIDYFDQIDVVKTDKDIRFLKRKPKNFSLSYKTSNEYFNVYLLWAGKKIKSLERVSRGEIALVSPEILLKQNTQRPDLKDPK